MKIRRSLRVLFLIGCGVALVLGCVLVFGKREPREPVYDGRPLSAWLVPNGGLDITPEQRLKVSQTVGPEALPWLIYAFERYDGQARSSWFYPYTSFYIKNPKWQKELPRPSGPDWTSGRHNAMNLLARLAPGSPYELKAAKLLAHANFDSEFERTSRTTQLYSLGRFTNCGAIVVPLLLTGLTNPNTVEASIKSLSGFPREAVPRLYSMALMETGFIRPGELALRKIDEKAYLEMKSERHKMRR